MQSCLTLFNVCCCKGSIDHMNQDMMITWSIDMDVACFKTLRPLCNHGCSSGDLWSWEAYGLRKRMSCFFIVTVFKTFHCHIHVFKVIVSLYNITCPWKNTLPTPHTHSHTHTHTHLQRHACQFNIGLPNNRTEDKLDTFYPTSYSSAH